MESIVRVFLVGSGSKAVRYDEETTVERVLQVVLNGIGVSSVAYSHFALRLVAGPSPRTSDDGIWLHPNLLIRHIQSLYSHQLPPSTTPSDLKLELRLRFIPQSAYELLLTESKAFFYLHEQVFDDFLGHVAWKVQLEPALELAALRVCRDYLEKQTKHCIDPKIDVDSIDSEAALNTFIPEAVLIKSNLKSSTLRKQFLSLVKKFSSLSTTDSVLRSLSILIDIVKFDVEIFKASIGAGWSSPVDLLVGPEIGISYRINERCDSSRLAELRSILEITVRRMESQQEKAIVQLKMSGTAQPMLITTPNLSIAESLAHLVDGYQMMYNQGDSVYKMKGLERCESLEMKTAAATLQKRRNHSGHGSTAPDPELRIKRENVTLKELIGGGQFGNVYKGIYGVTGDIPMAVAIKVCKIENEPADTQLILQESHLMRNFRHDNIITLIGVCMDSPMWLVMELAAFGELRQYLITNRSSLELQVLLLFCSQISSALEYLHSLQFVHRDVAARNVLVCATNLVKLTDFGLSRKLDYDAVYTASRGKLPIKWMAPESINFREFSMASDVWMFGVCCWEVLSWGQKPWSGVANMDVISEIEAGHRPPSPDSCPISLFNYIETQLWSFEPSKRPLMQEVTRILRDVGDQLKRRVHPDQVRIVRPPQNIPVIRTNIESLPNLTLWRTLEEQRRQMEEDERWLREQESDGEDRQSDNEERQFSTFHGGTEDENLNRALSTVTLDEYRPLHSVTENGNLQSPLGTMRTSNGRVMGSSRSLPNGIPSTSSSIVSVRRATTSITTCVSKFTNAFNQNMKHEEFVQAIKEITARLREMFSEAASLVADTSGDKRREIDKCEALIGNDMRQMSRAMQALVNQTATVTYNTHRRDIVRICGDLEVNCHSFLTLLETKDQSIIPPGLQPVLSDC